MKAGIATTILFLAAANENYANEADTNRLSTDRSVTVVYRASREQVESVARRAATNLWRVELEPGIGKAVVQEWKSHMSDIPRENEVRAGLNYHEFKFFWMPPKVATQKVSKGGRIVPLRSPVWMTVGSLKTNNSIAFITLSRDLQQRATMHIPYTEIPAGRGTSSASGVYRTDIEWLRSLLGTNTPIAEFVGAEFFDPEVVQVLQAGTNYLNTITNRLNSTRQ